MSYSMCLGHACCTTRSIPAAFECRCYILLHTPTRYIIYCGTAMRLDTLIRLSSLRGQWRILLNPTQRKASRSYPNECGHEYYHEAHKEHPPKTSWELTPRAANVRTIDIMESSKLFRPARVGNMVLDHRVGMSPLTRLRASNDHIPLDIVTEYYSQRASVAGTLLISEGTFISKADRGVPHVPGIYNERQICAWRQVTDAVHRKGSYIFCQLWVLGRAVISDFSESEGMSIYSSSATPLKTSQTPPRELTVAEIQEKIDSYVSAARNAIAAGFDGVELHGANGYLIDQFTQDCCNKRTDQYGGSIENRSRFAVELVTAVSKAIGPERVGIRLSPWSTYNEMKMDDPIPQFSDLIAKISHLNIAYLHLIEARIAGPEDLDSSNPSESLAFVYNMWKGPIIVAGGFTPESARQLVDVERPDKDIIVMFGRHFLSTPDLPFRIRNALPLNSYDRGTFYAPQVAAGYIDYPFCNEFLQQQPEA
ncbi:hypothetical protein HD806DRAFT_499708 [Xylariaceae sp. AK1471]|nr:hypothetical protein HD806DRAFT_499708 [Xylariaceae sp. AK1471]